MNPSAQFTAEVFASRGRMYAAAYSVLRNHEDAEDATQNALCKALANGSQFRNEAKLSTWLHRIAYNEALMIRRMPVRHHEQQFDPAIFLIPAAAPDPLQVAAARQRFSVVLRVLAGMQPRMASDFIRHFFLGEDYSEVSRYCGLTESAPKSNIRRARIKLTSAAACD